MDNQANVVGARPGDAERPRESDVAALGRGGRMSRQRKTAAVLRLLRGEDLETVSRELGVTAATLTGWHDAFLAAGEAALTSRPGSGEELQSDRLKARLGAALIERDLLNEKIALLEADRPFVRRRRKLDLLRESGEFPMSDEELDDTATTVLRRNLRKKRSA